MIKNVKIVNSYGNSIELPLDSPQTTGYAITGIDGLDPPQVDIKQTQMVSGLKYRYNFGFHKYREITINIIYYEDNISGKNVDTLRNELMSLVKTNDEIILDFGKTEKVTSGSSTTTVENHYFINGWVSQHSPTIFAAQTGCVIKVTCPDPWFKKKVDGKDYDELQNAFRPAVSGLIMPIQYLGTVITKFYTDTRGDPNAQPTEWLDTSYYLGKTFELVSEYGVLTFVGGQPTDFQAEKTSKLILKIPANITTGYTSQYWYIAIDYTKDNLQVYMVGNNNEKIDCIGYVDIMDIIERKELAKLYPCSGKIVDNKTDVNIIKMKLVDYSSIVYNFYIYFNILYGGL